MNSCEFIDLIAVLAFFGIVNGKSIQCHCSILSNLENGLQYCQTPPSFNLVCSIFLNKLPQVVLSELTPILLLGGMCAPSWPAANIANNANIGANIVNIANIANIGANIVNIVNIANIGTNIAPGRDVRTFLTRCCQQLRLPMTMPCKCGEKKPQGGWMVKYSEY